MKLDEERSGKAMTARHVHVTGRVQGVSFRAWARERALDLGVSGWIRNRTDGSVEAVISGASEAVEALITALRTGPPAAEVEDLRVTATDAPAEPGFRIRD